MTSVYFDRAVSDDERRRGLYAGDIFIQSPSRHSAELIELARGMVEEALNPYDPRTIHKHKSPEELAEMLAKVKPAFIHHPECKRIIPALLEEMGCDPNETYFDVPRLRTAYPKGHLNSCPSRHVVLGADVPGELVDADLSALGGKLHGVLPEIFRRAGRQQFRGL
jgi:hypothetical protein